MPHKKTMPNAECRMPNENPSAFHCAFCIVHTALGKTALLVWCIVVVFVCVRAAVQPYKRSLVPTWERSGADWQEGRDLYRPFVVGDLEPFRYSPLTAVLLVPLHQVPIRLGGVAWRLLNAVALLGGFALWLRAAPRRLTPRQWGILFLLLVPLSLTSLNNGQSNPLVIGLLLASLAAVDDERWWLAAACLALATAWKVYPLSMGLLLAAAYPRRLGPRLLLALVVATVLPFACQNTEYVYRQYALWLQKLSRDQRWYWPAHMAYRDLWLLLRHWQLPLTPSGYRVVQLAAALGCAALCLAMRQRGWPRRDVLAAILALASCWMMLCGPATESATYVLLAPALAWAVHSAASANWPRSLAWITRLSFVLLLLCVIRGLWPGANQFHALGLQPLAALLLGLCYTVVFVRRLCIPPGLMGTHCPRQAGSHVFGQTPSENGVGKWACPLTN